LLPSSVFYRSIPLSLYRKQSFKRIIAHLRLHSGMITGAGNTPDIFVGGLQVIPQFTLVEHKVRGGIVAGAAYSYKKLSGMFWPTVSLISKI
jgi:hypothetical protein